jgi:hypothetical protein
MCWKEWRDQMKILLFPRLSDEVIKMAEGMLPPGFTLEVIRREAGENELADAFMRAHVLMGYVRGPFSATVLEATSV